VCLIRTALFVVSSFLFAEYFQTFRNSTKKQVNLLAWDASHVVAECINAVELHSPAPRSIVGADGKFLLHPLSLLPDSLQTMVAHLIRKVSSGSTQACVKPAAMTKLPAGY
jgi:hypothetical protein